MVGPDDMIFIRYMSMIEMRLCNRFVSMHFKIQCVLVHLGGPGHKKTADNAISGIVAHMYHFMRLLIFCQSV